MDPRLTKTSVTTLLLRSCYVGLEFACSLVLARTFGASSYGAYAFAVSCVTLLAIPAALGFDRLLVREVSICNTLSEWSLLKGILRRSTQLVAINSIALTIFAALGLFFFGDALEPTISAALFAGIFAIPLVAYARIRQAALQGLGRVTLGQVPETVAQPGLVLILVAIFHSSLTPMNTSYLPVLLYVGAAGMAGIFGTAILLGSIPSPVRTATPDYRSGEWLRQAIAFAWLLGMNAVITYADTVAVGFLRGPVEAGVYRIASQMAMLVAFPLTAINMAAAPIIAALYAKNDMQGLKRIAKQTATAAFALAVPAVLILISFGNRLLELFGPEFGQGYQALAMLSLAYLINAGAGAAGYLLIMTKHEKAAAWGFTLAAVLHIVGLMVFVRTWGITGAALATSASVIFVSIYFAAVAYRKLGVKAIASVFSRHMPS